MLVHLLAEKRCVEEFLSVLAQEAHAMKNGLFAELPSITEQKAGLLDRMAALDQAREAAQVARGFEPGRAGGDAAAAADGDASLAAWNELLDLAQQARAGNRQNGAMVYGQIEFTQNALNYLQATSAQPFYGPDGIRRAGSGTGTRIAVG
ncbi:flagella synthesis protein FlgN [Variovorax sp. TBS-050B]|jgi:flagella synthesis protein FlgN|uniref:flagella synthesis protein FlgN n=1 Tax=Variovorax sp. TBS-050B TaxID=2940551 RepID=UPI00247445D3|nr:flagellar protein FlgN [Variovorax sp. TBS-050B]MDH6591142.1 flagella synthesis protein FlgN [Variovorax sp. TBS-050B]